MKTKNIKEIKEQLQEDILTIIDGFGIAEAMEEADFHNLSFQLCEAVNANIDNLSK